MTDDIHPMKCPNCETTIRATNVEWFYKDDNRVVSANIPLTLHPNGEHEQLWYCPNDECRIVRLLPGDDDE